MKLQHKAVAAETKALADERQVRVIVSTSDLDRVGDVVLQDGIDLTAYRSNPIVLWNHDRDEPIARCAEIGIEAGKLTALVQFPPEGVSPQADKTYGLILAGVINAASIGFAIKDDAPLDPKKPFGGALITASELYEFSFVSVPAVRQALVVERSERSMKLNKKGLYEVAWLASLLSDLGWIGDYVDWEAAIEGDGSKVPAMLYAALTQLGETLVAMTQEEVAEFLADARSDVNQPDSGEGDDPDEEEEAVLSAGATIHKFLPRGIAQKAFARAARKTAEAAPVEQLVITLEASEAIHAIREAGDDAAAKAARLRAAEARLKAIGA